MFTRKQIMNMTEYQKTKAIKSLLAKGLLRKAGRTPGGALLYETTPLGSEVLRHATDPASVKS